MRQIIDAFRNSAVRLDYSRMRRVFIGGDWVPLDVLEEMQEVFPNAEIHVLYGPTEGTIICASHHVRRDLRPERNLIGRPLGNVRLRVIDRDQNLTPVGVPGELLLGGKGVTRGYLRRDELTAEKYTIIDDERYYRTGDLVRYQPDGSLEFLGRIDEQVKIRGFRVELGEIESVLADQAAIHQAVVLALGAPNERRLVAYIVPDSGTAPDDAELRSALRARLPDYMIPSEFTVLESLPLGSNGKVNRKLLGEMNGRKLRAAEYIAPRNDLERAIAGVWIEVLRLDRIGVDDNFFAVGGHSLLLVQLLRRLDPLLKRRHTVVELFRYPTIAALAAYLASEQVESNDNRDKIAHRADMQRVAISRSKRPVNNEARSR